jgi:recombination protein RecA
MLEGSAQIKDGEEVVGNQTKVKVVKNKCAPPYKTAEFDIFYGRGINTAGELLDLACEKGVNDKKRKWYSYKEKKIGQGREAVSQLLRDNSAFFSELLKELNDLKNGKSV